MSPYCTSCGSEVEASWNACPNCGKVLRETETPQPQPQIAPQPRPQPPPQPYQVQPYRQPYGPPKPTQYGTAALICGLIGICCGLFLAIPAIILGALGLKRDENTSMASIGIVLGVIDIICWILSLVLLFAWTDWLFPI